MHRRAEAFRDRGEAGYTIVELAIVLSIVGILAAVGGSQYASYLDRARTARAIAELQAIAKQLEPLPDEDWTYPASLADAGITMLDPWGNPYRYLLISGNLPRGLSDATEGLPPVAAPSRGAVATSGSTNTTSAGAAGGSAGATVDPSTSTPGGASDPGGGTAGTGAADPGTTGSTPGAGAGAGAGASGGAGGDGGGPGAAGAAAGSGRAPGGPPGGSIMGEVRKDRFQVPINSDFDLYSAGPDGQSRGPLSAKVSRDDVIRANDGAYYGVAEDF